MSSGPKVSILTPAFNHERFVEASIRSAWAQTYQNVEHVIVDDCSSDRTPELIEALVEQAPIETRFVRNAKNIGPGATMNRAFSMSTGDWICFLASDDRYAPWKLERLLAFGSSRPDAGVLHGDCWTLSETDVVGERIYPSAIVRPADGDVFVRYALGEVGVNGLGVLIRRAVFESVGGNDERLMAEDFDLFLRLARVTRFAYLDEPVAFIRTLQGSLGRSPARFIDSTFAALERQREELGVHYKRAIHTLHLRAFDAFARHGPRSSALFHAKQALRTARGPGEFAGAARHLSITGARETMIAAVGEHIPTPVRSLLRSLNRALVRKTYGRTD